MAVRDGRYLLGRYAATKQAPRPYHWVVVWRAGTPVAVAIIRRAGPGDPRLKGIRLAIVSDLVSAGSDRGALFAALAGAESVARGWDADGLLATQSNAVAAAALRRSGYLPVPGTVHLLTRNVTSESPGWPSRLSDWWITRGDGESDAEL
jgi:hypothetical protein